MVDCLVIFTRCHSFEIRLSGVHEFDLGSVGPVAVTGVADVLQCLGGKCKGYKYSIY